MFDRGVNDMGENPNIAHSELKRTGKSAGLSIDSTNGQSEGSVRTATSPSSDQNQWSQPYRAASGVESLDSELGSATID